MIVTNVDHHRARLEGRPLGERFPALYLVASQPVDLVGAVRGTEFSTRAKTMLLRAGVVTCEDLAHISQEELRDVRGVGSQTVVEVLRALHDFEIALMSRAEHPLAPPVTGEFAAQRRVSELAAQALQRLRDEGNPMLTIESELDLVAQWSVFSGRRGTFGGMVDSVAELAVLPADVRAAWDAVRQFEVPVELPSYQEVLHRWMASLPEREHDVLLHRIVRADRTLADLGQVHGVSRERIRQVERKLRDALEHPVAEDEWRHVRWAAHRLATGVGAWARVVDVHHFDPSQDVDRLVTVLAGLEVNDEVVRRRGLALPRQSDLQYLEPEGELLDLDDAREQLSALGVHDAQVEHALASMGLKQIDGTWVRWSQSFVDQSVALLAVVGEPMTADELAERTGSASVRSLRQRLYEDPRVQRVNRTEVGLRSWGLPEYTSVAELMLKVIADSGGSMSVSDLTTHLLQVYQVPPGTVAAYTAAPVFVVSAGMVRARGRSEPYEVDADPTGVPGLSLVDEDRFSYQVRVDHELLRGSGRPAPEALAGLLNLQPGRSLLFAARDAERMTTGSVVVSWSRTSHVGPHFGSLRAQALHDGAREGDVLRLTFDPSQMSVHHAIATG